MARPTFKPTAANKRQVAIAAGAGMNHDDIASALGITPPTLRKYFKAELRSAANMKRIEVLVSLHAAARGGSASAARAYLANVPQGSAAASNIVGATVPAPEGKKAQAADAAKTASTGTDWDGLLPADNVVRIRK